MKINKKQITIITGGGGFLARAHASAILSIGGLVILLDINVKGIQRNIDFLKKKFFTNDLDGFKIDVTNEISVRSVVKKIIKKYKKIDILINNAAIDSKVNKKGKLNNNSKFENFLLGQWDKEIKVGLTGYFLCSKVVGNFMSKKKRGNIINISSDLSIIAPDQSIYNNNQKKPVTYSVIKTGIVGLTKYLASYWARDNIRVNAISPGPILNNQNAKFINKLKKKIPLGRLGRPEEIESAVQFLASEKSSYITGQNIVIDGGRTII